MATDEVEAVDDLPEGLEDDAPKKKGGGGALKWIVIIVVVMAAEGALFYMLMGGSGETVEAAEEEEEIVEENVVEVEVDNFTCTNSRAAPGSIIHITIGISALVESGQDVNFQQMVTKSHQARVREATLQVLRNCTLSDLADPRQANLKRLMREEINKVLKKSMVREILISKFSQQEQ